MGLSILRNYCTVRIDYNNPEITVQKLEFMVSERWASMSEFCVSALNGTKCSRAIPKTWKTFRLLWNINKTRK